MKKLILLLLALPLSALAQLQSPTYSSVTITPPASSTTQALNTAQSSPTSGSIAGPLFYNYFQINHNYQITGSDNRAIGFYEQFVSGGTDQTGRAIAMFINQNHGTASASGGDHIAFASQEYTNAVDTSGGQEYAISSAAIAASGASVTALVGEEIDVEVDNGATVPARYAIRAVNQGANTASTQDDAAFAVMSSVAGGGFKHAFQLSNYMGQVPIQTSGDFFQADSAMIIGNWANLPNLTVTGDILSFPNVTLTGGGALALAEGIIGTTSGASAPAGYVGDSPKASSSQVSMVTGVAENCASLPLSAGDYNVQGTIQFNPDTTTAPSYIAADVSGSQSTFDPTVGNSQQLVASFSAGRAQALSTPIVHETFSAATTIYLIGASNFGGGTMTCSGKISATRIR